MLSISVDDLKSPRNRKAKLQYQYHDIALDTNTTRTIKTHASKFLAAILITVLIIFTQVLIFHYYIGLTGGNVGGSSLDLNDWSCIYPNLGKIYTLANRYDVDLVIVDPDLLNLIKKKDVVRRHPNTDLTPQFSQTAKRVQETKSKTVIHLAAINETSGGQPNLKLFFNALKHNGYTTLKYVDTSQLMQPEVYRRASHLFDDMPLDGITGHKYSHDSNDKHTGEVDEVEKESLQDVHQDKVSKIYTEFISHIFILNHTHYSQKDSNKDLRKCKTSDANSFIVIHVFVLYNFDYDPTGQWIQPGLILDEMDKHKLLNYNVHSFDLAIPIEDYYLHPKRNTVSLVETTNHDRRAIEKYLVFEPAGDGSLGYVNNSYVHCKASQFHIGGLIDNPRRLSNYLRTLDSALPILIFDNEESLRNQISTAMQFIDTYSKTYGNFSFWITGSTLLAYYKYCELALVPTHETFEIGQGLMDSKDIVINLEIGFFSSEVSNDILEDLASAKNIGVSMISDWHKPDAIIIFQLKDCPNIIFNMYPYELRNDFFQQYFVTRNTMTFAHKFSKKFRFKNAPGGHHVFNTNNLELCWTRIDKFHPFRVPCNIYDHLRRIYII